MLARWHQQQRRADQTQESRIEYLSSLQKESRAHGQRTETAPQQRVAVVAAQRAERTGREFARDSPGRDLTDITTSEAYRQPELRLADYQAHKEEA
jgi:hypothetical protein